MQQGLTFLLGSIPAVLLAALAAFLIHDGSSAWVWSWFLLLAFIVAIGQKSDDD